MIKKLSWFNLSILTVVGLAATSLVYGAATSSVSVTVSAQNISVSVSDGTVAYGSLALGASASTTLNDINDSQTATNTGSITENFNIKGQNTANWTLAGTTGTDQYVHEFCNNGTCDASPSWTALTTNYATLATGKTTSQSQEFDLEIKVPTGTSYYTQQSADVIVQAVSGL